MLRRLRSRAVRAPRVIISLVLIAFATPALAGPLAYCLLRDDAPRLVAAASHCETMAESALVASALEASATVHPPAVDEAAGVGGGAVSVPSVIPSFLFVGQGGGLLPPLPDLLPSRDDAYGGAASDPSVMRSLAGAIAGRSVRLLV